MSKAVLISIQPKWCELIASGKKTVEVRKTKPKIDVPFKCYIYCTKGEHLWKTKDRVFLDGAYNRIIDNLPDYLLNGKVIGEFICRNIDEYDYDQAFDESMGCFIDKYGYDIASYELGQTCLSYEELESYGNTKRLYGWNVNDLVIYDKPKELGEFKQCHKCEYYANCIEHELSCDGTYNLTTPPQSWCYVE